jgi:hypothetical protein
MATERTGGKGFNWETGLGLGAGLGGIFGGLFGGGDPYGAGIGAMQRVPGILESHMGAFQPMLTHPAAEINRIMGQYQESPAHHLALMQALQGANQAAAAGGMAGTPLAQQQGAGIASQMADQGMQQFLQNVLGVQRMGAAGETGLGQDLASVQESIAQMREAQAQQQAQQAAGMGSGIGGVLGAVASFL